MKSLLFLGLFLIVGFLAKFHYLDSIDATLFSLVDSFCDESVYNFFLLFTKLSGSLTISLMWLIIMVALFVKRAYDLFVFSLYFSLLLVVLSLAAKYSFQIPRPPHDLETTTGYSYPSGHAVMAIIIALILLNVVIRYVQNSLRRFALLFVLMSYLILSMMSRIVLHVHYFSDIVGSILLALFCYTYVKDSLARDHVH